MNPDSFLYRAFRLYYDGFRGMTLGRTLWLVIAVKLFVIFVVLKIFFFPNFLRQHAPKGGEAEFVAKELTERADPPPALPCREGAVTIQEQPNPKVSTTIP